MYPIVDWLGRVIFNHRLLNRIRLVNRIVELNNRILHHFFFDNVQGSKHVQWLIHRWFIRIHRMVWSILHRNIVIILLQHQWNKVEQHSIYPMKIFWMINNNNNKIISILLSLIFTQYHHPKRDERKIFQRKFSNHFIIFVFGKRTALHENCAFLHNQPVLCFPFSTS